MIVFSYLFYIQTNLYVNIHVVILYVLILSHFQILKLGGKELKSRTFYLRSAFMSSFENLPSIILSHNTLFDQSEHVLVYLIEQCIQCFGISKS